MQAGGDAKFEFRKSIAAVAERLRDVFTAFMRAKKQGSVPRRKGSSRKSGGKPRRPASVAEEERKRLESEDPVFAHISEPEPLPALPVAPEPVKIQVGGGIGRKAGLKTVYVGRILDWQKVLQHFSGHQQIRDLLQKLVDADVRLNKAQCSIPGVEIVEERVAA